MLIMTDMGNVDPSSLSVTHIGILGLLVHESVFPAILSIVRLSRMGHPGFGP